MVNSSLKVSHSLETTKLPRALLQNSALLQQRSFIFSFVGVARNLFDMSKKI